MAAPFNSGPAGSRRTTPETAHRAQRIASSTLAGFATPSCSLARGEARTRARQRRLLRPSLAAIISLMRIATWRNANRLTIARATTTFSRKMTLSQAIPSGASRRRQRRVLRRARQRHQHRFLPTRFVRSVKQQIFSRSVVRRHVTRGRTATRGTN